MVFFSFSVFGWASFFSEFLCLLVCVFGFVSPGSPRPCVKRGVYTFSRSCRIVRPRGKGWCSIDESPPLENCITRSEVGKARGSTESKMPAQRGQGRQFAIMRRRARKWFRAFSVFLSRLGFVSGRVSLRRRPAVLVAVLVLFISFCIP